MAGIEVKGNVQGTYSPVGATSSTVITNDTNWDGIASGISKLGTGLINMYENDLSEASKQLKAAKEEQSKTQSGIYQIQMDDIRKNPNYHNSDGTINARGYEAIRALNIKNANLGSSTIQSVQESVGGGYKNSYLEAKTKASIEAKVADEQATNKSYVDAAVRWSPQLATAPYETKLAAGKMYMDKANAMIQTYQSLIDNDVESVRDPMVRQLTNQVIGLMSPEQVQQLRDGVEGGAEGQQATVDTFTQLGVQMGMPLSQARMLAVDVGTRVHQGMNDYRNSLTQLSKDEIEYMTSSAKNQALKDMTPNALALYALTGQQTPTEKIKFLANSISSIDGDIIKTEGNSRVMLSRSRPLINTMLNFGNDLTKSATLGAISPDIVKELANGNISPLTQLTKIPNMSGVMAVNNTAPEFQEAKQTIKNGYAEALSKDIRSYVNTGVIAEWVGLDNRRGLDELGVIGNNATKINEIIRGTISNLAYLGYDNEEIKNVVNSSLESVGLKAHKGAFTTDELADIAEQDVINLKEQASKENKSFTDWTFELQKGVQSIRDGKMSIQEFREILDKKASDAGMSQPSRNNMDSANTNKVSVNPEPMTKKTFSRPMMTTMNDVYNSKEYKDAVGSLSKQVKNGSMTDKQAENELNIVVDKIKMLLSTLNPIKTANASELEELPVLPKGSTKGYLEEDTVEHTYTRPTRPYVEEDKERPYEIVGRGGTLPLPKITKEEIEEIKLPKKNK